MKFPIFPDHVTPLYGDLQLLSSPHECSAYVYGYSTPVAHV